MNANSLARLVSTSKSQLARILSVETLKQPNILEEEKNANHVGSMEAWKNAITNYLNDGTLPENN